MQEYYIICRDISLDSNQWQFILGISSILIGIVGFFTAYHIYRRQRKDSSKDAYNFFKDSLPDLDKATKDMIDSLKIAIKDLDENKAVSLIIPTSLKANCIDKLNILDLKRYFKFYAKDKIEQFNQFILSCDYINAYSQNLYNQIDDYKYHFYKNNEVLSKFQLLRSNTFFSSIIDENEDEEYKNYYICWVSDLNKDENIFNFDNEGNIISLKSIEKLVGHIKLLAKDVFKYIENSEKANNVNLLANQVVQAFDNIENINEKYKNRFNRDIEELENISKNIKSLLGNNKGTTLENNNKTLESKS